MQECIDFYWGGSAKGMMPLEPASAFTFSLRGNVNANGGQGESFPLQGLGDSVPQCKQGV